MSTIKTVTFEEILPVWENHLWPGRTSPIKPISAMKFLGDYDLSCKLSTPTFFAYIIYGAIAGVNSGHKCPGDNSFRSRGLYVFPGYRGHGIGRQLLLATIAQAKNENCDFVWSYPKKSSWTTYKSAGFTLASDWHLSELDTNAYCRLDLGN